MGEGDFLRFIEKSKKNRNFVVSGKGFYIMEPSIRLESVNLHYSIIGNTCSVQGESMTS